VREPRFNPSVWRALIGLLVVLAGVARATALSEGEINELYSDAKRFFREANAMAESQPEAAREVFAKAALRFERIVGEGGIRNGRLYYNIGNCYFRMEDLGRAIANYRRAESYLPNDPNLRQNLDYARRKRLDRIDVPERTKVLKTVLFFHYDLGQRTRAGVFAAAFAGLWLLLSVRLLWRSAWLSWLAGISAVVSLLLLGSLLVEWRHLRTVRPGVVVAAEATARKGDGMSFEPAFTEPLHAGTEFRLLEDRGEWLEVALDDGRTCWLPAKDTERVR
jgi:tetratricopeptide (TPR) repeat protein